LTSSIKKISTAISQILQDAKIASATTENAALKQSITKAATQFGVSSVNILSKQ